MSASQGSGWTLEHLALVAADLGAWDWDVGTNRVVWSAHVHRLYGTRTFDGTVEAFVALIHPDDRPAIGEALERALAGGPEDWSIEHRLAAAPDVWLSCSGRVFRDAEGRSLRMAGIVQDVTERRRAERERLEQQEALRQSQKLEALGRLAGGIAHDFNNVLAAIAAFAALGKKHAHTSPVLHDHLEEIARAAARGSALTRQLLSFGRRDVHATAVFDVRERVEETMRMLAVMVGERVQLVSEYSREPCLVNMDAGRLQQVVVNLGLNARDAMVEGGRLSLTVEREGDRWVLLSVRDNGSGMDETTRQRALEPFFTTKPVHEGTGLGLSTCHGIVTDAGGTMTIESAPGRGTAIHVRLPRVNGDPGDQSAHAGSERTRRNPTSA